MTKPKQNTAKTRNRDRKGRFAVEGGGWSLLWALLAALCFALALWWLDARCNPVIVSPIPDEEKYVSPIPETKAKPAIQLAVVPIRSQEERDDDNHSFYVETFAQKYARDEYERY